MSEQKRIWPIVMTSLLGFTLLCGLGFWQLFRLTEKNALIEKIDRFVTARPISLDLALKQHESGRDLDYVAVQAIGQFLEGQELHKLTTHEGGPGFSVIAPFISSDGILVLVDRGTVPVELADPAKRGDVLPRGVTGYFRVHDKGQGAYDADNIPAQNQWYWWDVPAMLGAVKAPPDVRVMDVILHRVPRVTETTPPIAPKPKAELRNNHMGYAITWFGLALVLAVIATLMVQRARQPHYLMDDH